MSHQPLVKQTVGRKPESRGNLNGVITKIERTTTRGVHKVEFSMFDISDEDFLLLQECINSREAWQIEIRPTPHAPDVVDSAASSDISHASEVSASEADTKPATTQVM